MKIAIAYTITMGPLFLLPDYDLINTSQMTFISNLNREGCNKIILQYKNV